MGEVVPDGFVVGFAVAAVEGGDVFDCAFYGAAGHGVVGDGAVELFTGGGVLDFFPFGAGIAYADEATIVREYDTAVGIVPGI